MDYELYITTSGILQHVISLYLEFTVKFYEILFLKCSEVCEGWLYSTLVLLFHKTYDNLFHILYMFDTLQVYTFIKRVDKMY